MKKSEYYRRLKELKKLDRFPAWFKAILLVIGLIGIVLLIYYWYKTDSDVDVNKANYSKDELDDDVTIGV